MMDLKFIVLGIEQTNSGNPIKLIIRMEHLMKQIFIDLLVKFNYEQLPFFQYRVE